MTKSPVFLFVLVALACAGHVGFFVSTGRPLNAAFAVFSGLLCIPLSMLIAVELWKEARK